MTICDLCYRRCDLADGETGWCRVRRNDAGVIVPNAYGIVAICKPGRQPHRYFNNGARVLWLAGVSCTARCSFCTSCDVVHHPERLPEVEPGPLHYWNHARALASPEDVIARALRWNCTGIYFSFNEPMVMPEYVRDVATLARAHSLTVTLDTNAYSSVAAINAFAPLVDMAYVGIKGHADPAFYARHMQSPGAAPHVLAGLLAWRDTGVVLGVSDVVTPPHWLPDPTEAEHQQRSLYTWLHDHLGADVPLDLRPMLKPRTQQLVRLLRNDATPDDVRAYDARVQLAATVARDCGLRNVKVLAPFVGYLT